jgi:hypothetical protein
MFDVKAANVYLAVIIESGVRLVKASEMARGGSKRYDHIKSKLCEPKG